ncbi:MAG: flagellar basal body P-ring formation chaperone FlgA [Synergistaceae bacterium]|nr:flagellar basal body P-ring formation chaperone FlgA [Synergistaceae bacterium]
MRIRVLSAFVITILAILGSDRLWAAELRVSLTQPIEARDGWFYLGEYAEISGTRELADSASMAVIRHDGKFSRDDVIDALSVTEAAGNSVAIVMPDVVKVKPESDLVSELRNITAWKWRIDVDVIPTDWGTLISGYRGYILPPKITPGTRVLALKLEDRDGRQSAKQIKLTWYQPVVYSKRQLAKGDSIAPAALGTRIGTASTLITNISAPEQLLGAVVRKPVGVMTPIETGDITHGNYIRSGTTVTMVARVNGLGVEVKGVAMQRGGLGDIIRVKNLSSKKVLRARIIGPDRVEINL